MPPKLPHRDVAGFLSRVRNFFLGRTHKTGHRYADTVSARTQPAPHIPRGPSQDLSANYYYMRDPRGQLKPLVDVVEAHKQKLAAQEKAAEKAAEAAEKAAEKPAEKPEEKKVEKAADAGEDAEQDCDREDHKETDGEGAGEGAKKLPTPGKFHSWEGPC